MKNLSPRKKVSFSTQSQNGEIFHLLDKHVLGVRKILTEPGLKIYQLQDGTLLELYGVGAHSPSHIFKNANVVLSLNVVDVQIALTQLIQTGVKLISNIEQITATYAYCYVQLMDGTVLGLYHEKKSC